MKVRPVAAGDTNAWLAMRIALWPDETAEYHRSEVSKFFAGTLREPLAVLLAVDASDVAVGFAELNIRPYAEGCYTGRVAYLEGWYVDSKVRRTGVGAALIRAAEDWGRAQGCTEFASDALAANDISAKAHKALGFAEVEVIRCFRKDL